MIFGKVEVASVAFGKGETSGGGLCRGKRRFFIISTS